MALPPTPSITDLLFVYGTLRRGGSAQALLGEAVASGAARYQGRLYDLGPFPAAVPSDDPADIVHGELYAFPREEGAALLPRLDRYEGPDFRRERTLVTSASGEPRESWIYLYARDVAGLTRIAAGDYCARSSGRGSHS